MGEINNSYSEATVKGTFWSGGLVGNNRSGSEINNSYSTANVINENFSGGGLVGSNSGAIENSYSTGHVESQFQSGGLVGANREDGTFIRLSSYKPETGYSRIRFIDG